MIHAPADLIHRLKQHHQLHLLHGWDDLSRDDRTQLVNQLAGLDFEELEALYHLKYQPHTTLPERAHVKPLPVVDASELTAEDVQMGEAALRNGEVAVLVVAGGQGSRLGFEHPKGMFPIGPVSGKSLFQLHAEKVLALSWKYGKPVPFLVMTSPVTHDETEAFFNKHNFFKLNPQQVTFFQQGTMPALDLHTGQVLLEKPGQLFLSPNGHGGTLTALADSGLLDELKASGVQHLFYFQVDNPLVNIADPAFLGRHIRECSEASSKVIRKEQPAEKVGLLAVIDGRCAIIEYSDLPQDWAEERIDSGELVFNAGNPAIHLFDMDFLSRVTSGEDRLAFHVARKKVSYFDTTTNRTVEPTEVNAIKFELFIFDALPLAERWLAVVTPREVEFAPVKNADGLDSPATARRAMIEADAKKLEPYQVPRDENGDVIHAIEISPLADVMKMTFPGKITGPLYFPYDPFW